MTQRVPRGDAAGDDGIVRRVSAAEIEAAVVDRVRALLRPPEVVVGTWVTARPEVPDLKEGGARKAPARLDPLRGELLPAEQARVARTLIVRVVVGPGGADIRPHVERLAGLVRDLGAGVSGAEWVAARCPKETSSRFRPRPAIGLEGGLKDKGLVCGRGRAAGTSITRCSAANSWPVGDWPHVVRCRSVHPTVPGGMRRQCPCQLAAP